MELIPFVRCEAQKAAMFPGYVTYIQQADGPVAIAMIHGDFIYDNGRLCKIEIYKMEKDIAVILLPAPAIGIGCALRVPKNSLEWHR